MIQDRLIICIASSWDYDPTSKHHLMRILSRRNRVLWINYHGSRRPELKAGDLKGIGTALGRVVRGLTPVSPTMSQLTPLVVPGASNAVLRAVHRRLLIAQIRRAVRVFSPYRQCPVQVWSFAPDVPYLIGAFDEECFLYYCTDEYRQFRGFDARRITAAEDEMIDRADVVIATSEPLRQAKRTRRSDVVLVRHGVDFDHFATAWRTPPRRPSDLTGIQGPIFGFFGLVEHWVDRALLAEVARRRPQYSFVVIGECKVDVSELRALPNVYVLGRRPYEQLPAYAAAFDAAMLLFSNHAMTQSVNPVKMTEYLAAGLPIISTPLPEAERFQGAITIAGDAEAFAVACDRIVETPRPDREEISELVGSETWASKVEYLSDVIAARMNPVLRTASKHASEVAVRREPAYDAVPSRR